MFVRPTYAGQYGRASVSRNLSIHCSFSLRHADRARITKPIMYSFLRARGECEKEHPNECAFSRSNKRRITLRGRSSVHVNKKPIGTLASSHSRIDRVSLLGLTRTMWRKAAYCTNVQVDHFQILPSSPFSIAHRDTDPFMHRDCDHLNAKAR